MNVLHIHSHCGNGGGSGAEVALGRLQKALLAQGVDSHILCKWLTEPSDRIHRIPRSLPTRTMESVGNRLALRFGLNEIAFLGTSSIFRHPAYQAADVVHLHTMLGNYLSYLHLPRLCREKPVVFTTHDMWAFTGHCTVARDCERWRTGCGECPYPDEYPRVRKDNTRLEWKLKRWVYGRSHLRIHTLSTKQTQDVSEGLLGKYPITMIPHGIDTTQFRPRGRAMARGVLGIEEGDFVIMVAAAGLDRPAKGIDLLTKALEHIPEDERSHMVVLAMGTSDARFLNESGCRVMPMGHVGGDDLKSILYSAADILVSPSRGESFGLTVLESMACGTPCVTFGVGGLLDLVRPEETGLLADPENPEALARAIQDMEQNLDLRTAMGVRCRTVVETEYGLEQSARAHIRMYDETRANKAVG